MKSTLYRRALRTFLLLCCTAGMLATHISVASADDSTPEPESPSIATPGETSSTTITFTKDSTGPGDAPETEITCALAVHKVHGSTTRGFEGNISVHADWDCDAPMPKLDITIALLRDENKLMGTNYFVSQPGWNYLDSYSNTSCVPGTYRGVATGTFIAPPGYSPPSGSISNNSDLAPIACAGKFNL